MSDFVYRCEKCGDLRIVHNVEGEPSERIDAYCYRCGMAGTTSHRLMDCGRARFDINDHTHLTVFSTGSDESALMILIEDMFSSTVLDLDGESSKHLAVFLASEILSKGVSE